MIGRLGRIGLILSIILRFVRRRLSVLPCVLHFFLTYAVLYTHLIFLNSAPRSNSTQLRELTYSFSSNNFNTAIVASCIWVVCFYTCRARVKYSVIRKTSYLEAQILKCSNAQIYEFTDYRSLRHVPSQTTREEVRATSFFLLLSFIRGLRSCDWRCLWVCGFLFCPLRGGSSVGVWHKWMAWMRWMVLCACLQSLS